MRSLFIYWKTSREHAASAAADMLAMQRELQQRHPSLEARLYRRTDEALATATLMETYACPGGVAATLQAEITVAGLRACARWCEGERHVEVFDEWRDDDARASATP